MPPYLKIEVSFSEADSDRWVRLPDIQSGDRDGTISDNRPDGRRIYLFGVNSDKNQAHIMKSEDGTDVELISGERIVQPLGFLAIATLGPGQSHELAVITERRGPATFRFTYLEE